MSVTTLVDKYLNNTPTASLHIGFGGNFAYIRPVGVSITSIAVNNPNTPIVFHVFLSGINNTEKQRFAALARSHQNISLYLYSVDEEKIAGLPTLQYLPLATYYRLLIPTTLPNIPKLLYLDADIICIGGIDELYNMTFSDYICAATMDINITKDKKIKELGVEKYFNSGFLLINTKSWNENNVSEKMMSFLSSSPSKYSLLDQDALNILFENQIYELPDKWNCLSAIQTDTVFLHCVDHPKPWRVGCTNEEKQKLYLNYENLSPWKGTPLELPSTYREARHYSYFLFRRWKLFNALTWYCKYLSMKIHAKLLYLYKKHRTY